ncbi:uncharacterized protein LOC143225043 isoform X2 [Tachypleus tridentatus]|uniref:uncharacterized protein LOC143225043 isoform X2 n=1 Tax=Tachypleus tridentatus TaxID=6853 RepID=UPI003FD674DE
MNDGFTVVHRVVFLKSISTIMLPIMHSGWWEENYKTMNTKEDTDGERRQSLVQYSNNSAGNSHPPTPPQQNGHQRTSSGPAAPPAPHPPPMPVMSAVPPPPPLNTKAPPAPPPPPMSGAHTLPCTGPSSESGGIGGTSLAAALQGAKLRRTSCRSSVGGGNCESVRPGPVNLMDEISKTFARRSFILKSAKRKNRTSLKTA